MSSSNKSKSRSKSCSDTAAAAAAGAVAVDVGATFTAIAPGGGGAIGRGRALPPSSIMFASVVVFDADDAAAASLLRAFMIAFAPRSAPESPKLTANTIMVVISTLFFLSSRSPSGYKVFKSSADCDNNEIPSAAKSCAGLILVRVDAARAASGPWKKNVVCFAAAS